MRKSVKEPSIRLILSLEDSPTLQRIEETLKRLHRKVDILMTTVNDVKAIVAELNTETNIVASRIDTQVSEIGRLRALIEAGDGVTPADLDAIAAALGPVSARLKALAADPNNPVPSDPNPPVPGTIG